ncbi:uncharacterized protein LOC100678141 [Nasonia vitripennis]|uniref:Uncharacterized protein n=1 Tax=Nasonia vitripennis TaxID=7425 RepID=A0A7M7HC52_NASVI|nr:uncharacterized protein LOC100678141 [Nasonia vitripennis]
MSLALRLAALGLLLFGSVQPEWVEIPQFSDQQKVYRPPQKPSIHHHSHHPHHQQQQQHSSADRFSQKVSFHQEIGLRNVSGFPGNRRRPAYSSNEPSPTIATYTTERLIGSIVGEETHLPETDEGVQVETFEEEDNINRFEQPPIEDDEDEDVRTTTEALETSTEATTGDSSTSQQAEEGNKGFLDYLPIDLLKRVHKTLQSQPATLKGKIRFLKLFERTLVSEIESRLSAALSPARMPRDARGHHEYHDEHEHGIGFPSLEGTLMAISFLTFAVYLVRLVMMLFRSANNGNAAPIFIGRKRRSVDHFPEETARILGYLDSALPSRY